MRDEKFNKKDSCGCGNPDYDHDKSMHNTQKKSDSKKKSSMDSESCDKDW